MVVRDERADGLLFLQKVRLAFQMIPEIRFLTFIFTLLLACQSPAATVLPCAAYISYSATEQSVFAYGYLEGLQAALTKEFADILVPPSNPDHPIWWALPGQTTGPNTLAEKLNTACKAKPASDLLAALFSIAARKDGWPAFGIWVDQKTGKPSNEHQKWKKFLGEDPLTCRKYNTAREATKQQVVTGYFVGTEAYRLATKQKDESLWTAWPLGMSPLDVRQVLDKECLQSKDLDSSIRDSLWVITFTLWTKRQQSSEKTSP